MKTLLRYITFTTLLLFSYKETIIEEPIPNEIDSNYPSDPEEIVYD